MKTTLPLGWLLAVLGGFAATGCIASSEDEYLTPEAPPEHSDVVAVNAVAISSVTLSAVSVSPFLTRALTQDSLTEAQQPGGPLEDPSARQLFSYIVSCALPKGVELTYTDVQDNVYTFDGDLGIASDWGKPGGKCNATCRQWVSGCVLSRVDYLGQHVNVSLRGPNPALTTSWPEMIAYPNREAAYYGNIFSQPQRLLACLSPGQTEDPRVCGPSIANCGIEFQGSCANVCTGPLVDGSFINCRGPSDHAEGGSPMPYAGIVTVFLH